MYSKVGFILESVDRQRKSLLAMAIIYTTYEMKDSYNCPSGSRSQRLLEPQWRFSSTLLRLYKDSR